MDLESISTIQMVDYQSVENGANGEKTVVENDESGKSVSAAGEERDGEQSQFKPDKALKDALEEVNKKLRPVRKKAEYSYFKPTNSISIKILDEETNEVIREIPSKDRLELSAKILKMAGLILDERG